MRTILILALLMLLPMPVAAQFGPIVPEVCRTCACGFGGVLAIIQNVVNFIIGIAIIFATIIMVWAGGLYILSAANPESRSTANKMLINAVIGLLIVLSAWLIVDFVMKTLYDNGSEFGPWNSILLSGTGDNCIVAKPTQKLFTGSIFDVPGQGGGAGSGGGSCTPIPDSQLVTFDASATDGQTRRGTADTVQRFMNMRAAALRDGVTLKAGSTYRSPEEGEELWRSRGCRIVSGRTVCNGDLVAKPCSIDGGGSNHTKGTAIDIQTDAAGTAWLRRNAAQYGFYNRIASEPWHWSDTGY